MNQSIHFIKNRYDEILFTVDKIYANSKVARSTKNGKYINNLRRHFKSLLLTTMCTEDKIFEALGANKKNPYQFEVHSVVFSELYKEFLIVFRVPTTVEYHRHKRLPYYHFVALYLSDITKMFEKELNQLKIDKKNQLTARLKEIEEEKVLILQVLDKL